MSQQAKRPEKEFRAGSISAAIWSNEVNRSGSAIVQHSIKFEKRYQNVDGNWQQTECYFPRDLPKLQLVSAKAFEFCTLSEERADGPAETADGS